jgi:arsenical pump membrane protein
MDVPAAHVGSAASVVCIIVLGLVCFFTVRPTTFRSPFTGAAPITLNFVSSSVLGVILLRVLDIVSLHEVAMSIIAVGTVQPWAVLVIFFTLAYVSVSVDCTGLSKFIALSVLHKFGAGGDARQELLVVYLLSGIVAVIASNDVVILTLTPVLIHYCSALHKDPVPVLLAEYFGANTFSALLLVGNPTNIIAAEGTGLTFSRYLQLLAFPTLFTAVGYLLALRAFGIPPSVRRPKSQGEQHDEVAPGPEKNRADVAGDDGDAVTLSSPATAVKVTEDLSPRSAAAMSLDPHEALVDPRGAAIGGSVLAIGITLLIASSYTPIPLWVVTSCTCTVLLIRDCTARSTDPAHPNERRVVQVGWRRMPWETAPFAVSMFIIVGALTKTGWTALLGRALVSLETVGGVVGTAVGGLWLTVVLMNLLNNQPATILLTAAYMEAQPQLSERGSSSLLVSIILGSNICANFTIAGALAGLMWRAILEAHGVTIPWRAFFVRGLRVSTVPTFYGAIAVGVQAYLFT